MKPAGRLCILVSADGVILKTTPAAEKLLHRRDLLTIHNGRLNTVVREASPRLASLLSSDRLQMMRLPDRTGADYIVISRPFLTPDGARHHWLTLIAPEYKLDVTPASQLFELTPAETRLVDALINAGSHDGAMEKLGVSRNTVRAQMSSIFRKTGVTRQGQLIRLFTKIATIAHMCDDF